MTSTVDRIRSFIIENFLFGEAAEVPHDAASLLDSGIIDSTGVLDLLLFLEEEFRIEISDEEVVPANFDSVMSLARLAESKRVTLAA